MNWFKETQYSNVVYHGTNGNNTELIKEKGFVDIKGDKTGNWESYGAPSSSDLVYATTDIEVAKRYAYTVSGEGDTPAVIECLPVWSSMVFDEDFIGEIMANPNHALHEKCWELFSSITHHDQESVDFWREDWIQSKGNSHVGYEENWDWWGDLQEVSKILTSHLTEDQLKITIGSTNVFGFSKPLKVLNVFYI